MIERKRVIGIRAKNQASGKAPYAEGWCSADPRRPVLQDLLWAMLTSKAFMFKH